MSYTFGAKVMGWEKEGDPMGAKDAKETIGNIKSFSLEGSSGDEYSDKRSGLATLVFRRHMIGTIKDLHVDRSLGRMLRQEGEAAGLEVIMDNDTAEVVVRSSSGETGSAA